MEFVLVYVREAHPEGEESRGGRRGGNRSRRGGRGADGVGGPGTAAQPTSLEERHANARKALAELGLSFTAVLDDMKDSASHTWAAFPVRQYIIDRKGKVAYVGERGARGVNTAEMEQALAQLMKNDGLYERAPK